MTRNPASDRPNTTRPMPLQKIAAAHMAHGSVLVTSVHVPRNASS